MIEIKCCNAIESFHVIRVNPLKLFVNLSECQFWSFYRPFLTLYLVLIEWNKYTPAILGNFQRH